MSPLKSAIWSALLLAALLTLFLFLISGTEVGLLKLLLFFTVSAILITAIVFRTTQHYLKDRILPIYRAIFGLTSKKDEEGLLSTADPMKKVEKDVLHWADERIGEIRELQEQDDFRKEFIGNLAHELKTPLFNIQGYVSSLMEGALEDERVNMKFLAKANKNINRMIHLVEDMDNISTLESGITQLSMKRMDVVKCCQEVVDSLEDKAHEKKVRIIHKQTEPIYVEADEFRIGQVFMNLLYNSIVYGKEGGKVEVRYTVVDKRVMVEVVDNGPGIDPKDLPRIFERFYRVDKSRSRDVAGSGLGLSIVKHIIDAHNQSVTARSTRGEGATFTFTLKKVR
jgi:two-component system phosphate regulon sensor histidine kinase PhoR